MFSDELITGIKELSQPDWLLSHRKSVVDSKYLTNLTNVKMSGFRNMFVWVWDSQRAWSCLAEDRVRWNANALPSPSLLSPRWPDHRPPRVSDPWQVNTWCWPQTAANQRPVYRSRDPGADQSQSRRPGHYYRPEKLNEVSIILTGPGPRRVLRGLSNNIALSSHIDHQTTVLARLETLTRDFPKLPIFSRKDAFKVAS